MNTTTYENYENDVKVALAEQFDYNPNEITRYGNLWEFNDGRTFYVFEDTDDAKAYVMNESGFDGASFCEGATEESYWVTHCKRAGVDMDLAFPNGKPDFKYIAQAVLDIEGPEWFLSGYDGLEIPLDNGMVAYREN